jgi:hypothetical protein
MGFNRRKMEDERRRAAEKEAATRRATDRQIFGGCRAANRRLECAPGCPNADAVLPDDRRGYRCPVLVSVGPMPGASEDAACQHIPQKRPPEPFLYPSVRDSLPDEIKDRGQVRAMWQWARDLDRDDLLWREFCRPIEVETGSKEDLAIQLTEGWILGCSPTVTNQ